LNSLKLIETHWNLLKLRKNLLKYIVNHWMKHIENFEYYCKSLYIIKNFKKLLKTIEIHWKLLWIIENHWKSLKIIENHWKSLKIIENHWTFEISNAYTINNNNNLILRVLSNWFFIFKSLKIFEKVIEIHKKSLKIIEIFKNQMLKHSKL